MPKFMAQATHGQDDPERATLPFIIANVAASADQEAIVLLTIEGVWLATKGYADTIHHEGLPPLREVLDSLLANGGQVWACSACTKPRVCSSTPPSRLTRCDRCSARGRDVPMRRASMRAPCSRIGQSRHQARTSASY